MRANKRQFRFIGIAVAAAGLLFVQVDNNSGLGFGGGSAWAQQCGTNIKYIERKKQRRAPTISQRLGQSLENIGTMISEEKRYAEALNELNDLLGRRGNSSYDMGMIQYYVAWVSFEMDNTPGAIRAYEAALQQEDVPDGLKDTIRYSLSQLHFSEENYKKSLSLLTDWMQYQPEPQASHCIFLGQIYYTLQDYRGAVKPIETAIKMTQDAGILPKENWWGLLKTIYYEFGDLEKVREILEFLVLNYPPKPENWLQLASIYGELKQEAKQLAAWEVAYNQGFLEKETQLTNVAQLFMYHEAPIKAVWVLKKGMEDGIIEKTLKNYDTYSQALMYAKQYRDAVEPLEAAAKLSDDGDLYDRLGTVYIQLDDWNNAVKAFQNALDKGGLKRADIVWLSLGSAYFNLDKLDDALKAFREARKDDRSKKSADTWIKYLTNEKARRAQLRAAMR